MGERGGGDTKTVGTICRRRAAIRGVKTLQFSGEEKERRSGVRPNENIDTSALKGD